jgi:hypothetical protein
MQEIKKRLKKNKSSYVKKHFFGIKMKAMN